MTDKQGLINASSGQYEYDEQDPNYQGNGLDHRLKQGPLEDRGCKDVFWCFLYLGMLAGLVAMSVFAFSKGDPKQLLQPYDSGKLQCGYNTLADYPYVFVQSNTQFYCVSECPTDTSPLKCGEGSCPGAAYPSNLLITVCFPDSSVTQTVRDSISQIIDIGDSQQVLADLKNSWPLQLTTAFVALIISYHLLVTVLIRYTAACLVWTVIGLYFIGLVLLGVFCFETSTNTEWQQLAFSSNHEFLKVLAYFIWAWAGLSFLIFICLFKKVSLAIAVMKAAADFTRQVCEAALVPLVMFATIVGFFVFWLAISIFLVASGQQQPPTGAHPFGTVNIDSGVGWLLFYDLFALYWNCNFAMAFSQFVIASACSMWYFSHLGHDLSHPISKSVIRGLFHHSGSLALGSLILTFVGIIRFLLEQVHKAFKSSTMEKHGVVEGCEKCWFSYCHCCLKYFEKFIRFLNQNAYIMIGLTGESFCEAAHQAFYLLVRNAGKVAVTHGLGEIFTLLGNLFIAISSTVIGYLMLTQIDYFADSIVSPFIPTLGFLIVSLVVGSLFMNVYGMAVDAILLCYIADSELHRNEGGAKSVPPSLKEFLQEYS